MKPIAFLFLLILASCGDNIKTEKDKYPNIPEFPKFEHNIFITQHIDKIELQPINKFQRTFENDFNLKYTVKDSSLYLITYYNDDEFPNEAYLDYKYYLTLTKITNGKIEIEKKWIDSDFDFNFWIKKNNDVLIGKHIFSSKQYYINSIKQDSVMIDSINDIQFQGWTKDFYGNEEKTISNNRKNNFVEFDSVIINSESEFGGGWNNAFEVHYKPVYLNYYKLELKNKTAKTKINFNTNKNSPILLKANNDLYYIQYNEVINDNLSRKNKIFNISQIK